MDFITSILLYLKENPSTTLKKLAKHVKDEFDIQFSPAAIQKTLKNVKVTWKTVTPIPHKWNEAAFLQQLHKWNEAAFLQQQHAYVLNWVTNIGQNLIFIDKLGFNSNTCPSHGYSLSGKLLLFYFLIHKQF